MDHPVLGLGNFNYFLSTISIHALFTMSGFGPARYYSWNAFSANSHGERQNRTKIRFDEIRCHCSGESAPLF